MRASRARFAAISSVERPACTPSANTFFMQSMAQNRFTAVGRVPAIRSQIFWNSTANCRVPFAVLRCMPSAMPIAVATPMAGAPRITIVRIARATSGALLHFT